MNRHCFRMIVLTGFLLGVTSCAHLGTPANPGVLSQTSTITALLDGGYDGVITSGELLRQGDFGIGTFDHLDGEMVLIDGKVFQAKADGMVEVAPGALKVPFAAVTRFRADITEESAVAADYESLKKNLDALRTGNNMFYAIRVDGVFDRVKYRSVPPQEKPYPKLVDVAARQPVFERRGIRGTLVGFWCPEYVRTLNLPGYHLHFISADRKSAGHLLDCSWQGGMVSVEKISQYNLTLPQTPAFQTLNLGGDTSRALKAAESGK